MSGPRQSPPGAALPPAQALRARLESDPASPLVTFYDDATGERVELSATSLDNWVAKLAGLLLDELDPGAHLAVELPGHWLTAAVLLAAWRAGLVVDPKAADRVVDASRLGGAGAGTASGAPGMVLALSLAALAPAPVPPAPGVLDVLAEVAAYPDVLALPMPAPDTAAWVHGGRVLTGADLAAAAADLALPPGARVLTTYESWEEPGTVLQALLGPLAAGGSAVLCRHADPGRLATRITQERVDLVLPRRADPGSPARL